MSSGHFDKVEQLSLTLTSLYLPFICDEYHVCPVRAAVYAAYLIPMTFFSTDFSTIVFSHKDGGGRIRTIMVAFPNGEDITIAIRKLVCLEGEVHDRLLLLHNRRNLNSFRLDDVKTDFAIGIRIGECIMMITNDIIAMARPQAVHFENNEIVRFFKWSAASTNNVRAVFNLQEFGEHSFCGAGNLTSGFSYDPERFMENESGFLFNI
ncbi:hypothetical protein DICVIV_07686 [Dictyocaulus viviparus]|uniref:Uncharacterized protein n=1 Tax=Dictyocaulus viviparus TaxID=29172 RepID=A0A0D8XP09_DICVI|nr:hypothetical protein DICVIV_07686 [Dictyocaulus viviparus]